MKNLVLFLTVVLMSFIGHAQDLNIIYKDGMLYTKPMEKDIEYAFVVNAKKHVDYGIYVYDSSTGYYFMHSYKLSDTIKNVKNDGIFELVIREIGNTNRNNNTFKVNTYKMEKGKEHVLIDTGKKAYHENAKLKIKLEYKKGYLYHSSVDISENEDNVVYVEPGVVEVNSARNSSSLRVFKSSHGYIFIGSDTFYTVKCGKVNAVIKVVDGVASFYEVN